MIISSVISSCPSENFSLNYQIIADYDLTNSPPTVSRKGNYMGINLWYDIDYCYPDNYMHELIDVFPQGITTSTFALQNSQQWRTETARQMAPEERGGATACQGFI